MSFSECSVLVCSKRKLDYTTSESNSIDSTKSSKSLKSSINCGVTGGVKQEVEQDEENAPLVQCTQCKRDCFHSDIVYKQESKDNKHKFVDLICSWCALCESYGCGASKELDRVLKHKTDCLSCSQSKLCVKCAREKQTSVLVNNKYMFYDAHGNKYAFCSNCLKCTNCNQWNPKLAWIPNVRRAEDILDRRTVCRSCEEASVYDKLKKCVSQRFIVPSDFQGLRFAIQLQLKPKSEPVWEFSGPVESGYRIVASTMGRLLSCQKCRSEPAIFHITVSDKPKQNSALPIPAHLLLCLECLIDSTYPCLECGEKLLTEQGCLSCCASCRTKVQGVSET